MKISLSILITFVLSLFSLPSYAMKASEPQKVYVYNTITGYLLTIPIQVTYNLRGKAINRDVNPDEAVALGSGEEIREDQPITFSGRGSIKGKALTAQSISKTQLVAEWNKMQHTDTDPLVITLSTSGHIPPYALTLAYSTQLPEKAAIKLREQKAEAADNALALFPRIRYWELTDKISEEDVRRTKSWSDILVPGGRISNNTIAEDVYRYILGLDEKLYTTKEVNDAYRALSREWHSDRIPEENKHLADRVFILIKTAQDGLLQAIQEKPELQAHAEALKRKGAEAEEGWVEVKK